MIAMHHQLINKICHNDTTTEIKLIYIFMMNFSIQVVL